LRYGEKGCSPSRWRSRLHLQELDFFQEETRRKCARLPSKVFFFESRHDQLREISKKEAAQERGFFLLIVRIRA
jgi:hypothetical protein